MTTRGATTMEKTPEQVVARLRDIFNQARQRDMRLDQLAQELAAVAIADVSTIYRWRSGARKPTRARSALLSHALAEVTRKYDFE